MKKILLCFNLLFLFNQAIYGIGSDSLVYFNELKFESEEEKKAFEHINFVKQDAELLRLFLSSSLYQKSADAQSILRNFTRDLNNKIADKNEVDKIKIIKGKVKKTFLKTYQSKCNFSEIFESGTYNCISSIAIYGFIFSELKIPYYIKEDLNSIFIITYPESKKVVIESGTTEKNCFTYAEHFMNKFTKSMYYARIVPLEEFEKGYSEALFSTYYFTSSPVSLLQLASILYCNLSLTASDERKTQEAIYYMQKSYYLDASLNNKMVLKYHILNALGSNNYTNKIDVEKLVYLNRYNNLKDVEINAELILSEYSRLLNAQLTDQLNIGVMEKYQSMLVKSTSDSALKSELGFKYHFGIATKALNNWTEKKIETKHIQAAYKIKPNDKDLQSLITESFNISIQQAEDSEKLLKLLDDYCRQFEFVCSRNSTILLKANCYLDLAYNNFIKGLAKEGQEFINSSELLCKNNAVVPDAEFVEKGYVSAAKYFYNTGNRSKAKEYLNKGLQLAPESKLIQDKLKMVN